MAAGVLAPDALFLIAPALYFPGYDREPPVPPALTRVVHGWRDDIVTPDKAIRYAAKHQVPLTMLDAGHTLNERLPELSAVLGDLLELPKLHAAYRLAIYRIDDALERRIGVVDERADRGPDPHRLAERLQLMPDAHGQPGRRRAAPGR